MHTVTIKTERIERETEKAFQVVFESANRAGDPCEFTAWMPKSQVTVTEGQITVPAWLASEKLPAIVGMLNRIA